MMEAARLGSDRGTLERKIGEQHEGDPNLDFFFFRQASTCEARQQAGRRGSGGALS